MYHGKYNTLPSSPPQLSEASRQMLRTRQPGELLLYARTAKSFPAALNNLAAFQPVLLRAGELRAGPLALHVWLIRLGVYYDRQVPAAR
jgi:hypothetical protein